MAKIKYCHCGKPSLKGLKKGIALCQYHFDESIWGKEWADKCAAREEEITDFIMREWDEEHMGIMPESDERARRIFEQYYREHNVPLPWLTFKEKDEAMNDKTQRAYNQVLAALRLWQQVYPRSSMPSPSRWSEYFSNNGYLPMDASEIDSLCEHIGIVLDKKA